MEQRVSLGHAWRGRPRACPDFYERLGWKATLEVEETVFFQAGGMILGLWARDKLAADSADSAVTDRGGWGGVTLAHNVRSESPVVSRMRGMIPPGAP